MTAEAALKCPQWKSRVAVPTQKTIFTIWPFPEKVCWTWIWVCQAWKPQVGPTFLTTNWRSMSPHFNTRSSFRGSTHTLVWKSHCWHQKPSPFPENTGQHQRSVLLQSQHVPSAWFFCSYWLSPLGMILLFNRKEFKRKVLHHYPVWTAVSFAITRRFPLKTTQWPQSCVGRHSLNSDIPTRL